MATYGLQCLYNHPGLDKGKTSVSNPMAVNTADIRCAQYLYRISNAPHTVSASHM
jgi:hypothetical protein